MNWGTGNGGRFDNVPDCKMYIANMCRKNIDIAEPSTYEYNSDERLPHI